MKAKEETHCELVTVEEVQTTTSWEEEEEFRDYLSQTPMIEVNKERFDPRGDIKELEALLYGKQGVSGNEKGNEEHVKENGEKQERKSIQENKCVSEYIDQNLEEFTQWRFQAISSS
ncbi:hypothetical protein L1987_55018 [Smallanthus sonchifolius]|uniref:Uncharacterized protein n=1 Tax=Smallanthus sonchifolius TaxID=185202 RepID=A0ACB9E8R3_9ASTR|nr:hypothetical protein L1987_55018 [Smallanthus sonchifolius]